MPHSLPQLPYAYDALSPYISAQTVEIHYEKHHQGYVKKLNKAIQDTEHENASLETLITTVQTPSIFNNAAQTRNHTFYRNGMISGGKKLQDGPLLDEIHNTFGSFDAFQEKFLTMAAKNFGSGRTRLVYTKAGTLEILNTGNAQNPLTQGHTPLLTVDIREHAYYLDYQNRRPEYVDQRRTCINWENVSDLFEKTTA